MNFFALQLLFFAFAYRCVSARLVALPSPCHGCAFHFSSPPLSFSACRSRSLPLRCGTPQGSTLPSLIASMRNYALAFHFMALQSSALAAPFLSRQCPRFTLVRYVLPSPCKAHRIHTKQCRCSSTRNGAMQLQHKSCRCSATARRYSSWLNHAIALLGDFIGETAFAGITPLADTAQGAIVQPFQNSLFVRIVHQQNFKLTSGASRDLLTVRKAYTLALCGLGAKRTLALGSFRH